MAFPFVGLSVLIGIQIRIRVILDLFEWRQFIGFYGVQFDVHKMGEGLFLGIFLWVVVKFHTGLKDLGVQPKILDIVIFDKVGVLGFGDGV